MKRLMCSVGTYLQTLFSNREQLVFVPFYALGIALLLLPSFTNLVVVNEQVTTWFGASLLLLGLVLANFYLYRERARRASASIDDLLQKRKRLVTFWFLWFGNYFLSLYLGISAGMAVYFSIYNEMLRHSFLSDVVGLGICGFAGGAVIGSLQWLTLRFQRQQYGLEWIIATALGWAVGIRIEPHALVGGGEWWQDVWGCVAIGACVGVAQWLVLRHHVRRAELWVIANTLAMTSSVVVALFGRGNGD